MVLDLSGLELGVDFFSHTWKHEHRHFLGALRDPQRMLSWNDFNGLLGRHWLEAPRMRVTRDRKPVPMSEYTRRIEGRRLRHQLHPGRLARLLADGATLTIDAVDDLHEPIGSFAAKLRRLTGRAVQANLYAACESASGFGVHFDPHDVFVVQLYGTKTWRLYGSAASDGTTDELYRAPDSTSPVDELNLKPGDILYLPREYWHDVSTPKDTFSLHLTFGVHPATGRDLVEWVINTVLLTDPTLHADIPLPTSDAGTNEYVQRLQQVVAGELRSSDLLQRFSDYWAGEDLGRIMPSFPHTTAVPDDPTLKVYLLAPLLRIRETPDGLKATFRGKEVGLSSHAGLILDRLGDLETHKLGALAATAGLPLKETAAIIYELTMQDLVAVVSG